MRSDYASSINPDSRKRIVVTGGGTGGHVFPAIEICHEFSRRGYLVLYVGSTHGMEGRFVPGAGITFLTVTAGAIKNQGIIELCLSILKLMKGLWESFVILIKAKPSAVVGVGGYVSVPVCLAATILRIPLYIQEQNTSVGLANRLLGKLSKRNFLGFSHAESSFPHGSSIISGNPLRPGFFENIPPINLNQPCLLILGGSQGAKAINELIISLLPQLWLKCPEMTVIHQTGAKHFEEVRLAYCKSASGVYALFPFITDIIGAYAKATLVVSRSGALTISEIIQVARPSILIPLPRRGQNDQATNASLLESIGAARIVYQGEGMSDRFLQTFNETFVPPQLREMGNQLVGLRAKSSLATIADHIERDLN